MTFGAWLRAQGIDTFAAAQADLLPVTKPRLLTAVPHPRGVVFAAIPYFVGEESSNLAAFARPRDYHRYAERLSSDAAAFLHTKYPDAAVRGFADHSPFEEVRAAALAGLGIVGDHGLLITENYASLVFLFALVTELPLERLAEEEIPGGDGTIRFCSHCGACRRACPGGCIGSGSRDTCLSAITQKKNDLTEAETALLRRGDFVWGCDTCQLACPHTRRAIASGTAVTRIPYFREERITRLTTEMLEHMSETEYAAYAFGWRPKRVLARNLALKGEPK